MGLDKGLMNAMQDHKDKLAGPHFLLSAENPKFPQHNEMNMTHEQVLHHLRGAGYDAHPVEGHYGSPEKSIVVYGVQAHHANVLHSLASRLGQDSSIYSTGKTHEMKFHHGEDAGKSVHGIGTVWHDHKPADGYTTLPGNQHHFSHNFDFANPIHASAGGMKKSEEMNRINLVHYSYKQGLTEIDPKFKSTGHDARTKGRDQAHKHAFFYREGTEPEEHVANAMAHKYKGSIHPEEHRLYDIGEDQEDHVKHAKNENQGILDMDKVHGRLKDHGYKGFFNSKHPQHPNVVALYEPLKVEGDERSQVSSH